MATGRLEHGSRGRPRRCASRACRTQKGVEIWLPHNETTELVALRADAPGGPVAAGAGAIWLHHGSSISHGSNAASPTGTWPALAARAAGVDLVNLGLGGSALLDPFVARTIRDTPADVISLKLGINVVNADLMRRRAFARRCTASSTRSGTATPTRRCWWSRRCCAGSTRTRRGPGAGPGGFAEGRVRFLATGDPADAAAGS